MAQIRKYEIGCSGSGWGIWATSNGKKIKNCTSRYDAVKSLYELMGWYFNPAKFH